MTRWIFAAPLLTSGLTRAESDCHEYSVEELRSMSADDLVAARAEVTQKMIDAFVDDNEHISRTVQLNCEAQGRVLDRVIMAHREDAQRDAQTP